MEQLPTDSIQHLTQGFDDAWSQLESAIQSARTRWSDRTLESEDSDADADAWSPRLAAWHALSGERIRFAYVQHLVSDQPSDPVEMMKFAAAATAPPVTLSALSDQFRSTVTPEQMLAVMSDARQASRRLLQSLAPSDLDLPATLSDFMHHYLTDHGQRPTNNVRGSLLHGIVHLRDHAAQISR